MLVYSPVPMLIPALLAFIGMTQAAPLSHPAAVPIIIIPSRSLQTWKSGILMHLTQAPTHYVQAMGRGTVSCLLMIMSRLNRSSSCNPTRRDIERYLLVMYTLPKRHHTVLPAAKSYLRLRPRQRLLQRPQQEGEEKDQ
jgi:hypothetical protein